MVTIIPLLLLALLGLCAVVITRTDVLLLLPVKAPAAPDAATAVEPHQASGAARRRSLVPVGRLQPPLPEQRLRELRLEWRGRLISAALTLAFIVYPGASSQIVRAFRCQVRACACVCVHVRASRYRVCSSTGPLLRFGWVWIDHILAEPKGFPIAVHVVLIRCAVWCELPPPPPHSPRPLPM